MALPAQSPTAQTTTDALVSLFKQHGPPLVIKSDNDSAFVAHRVSELLADWGVIPLLSPLATPQYNGACEAGIGALKVRAHYEAARNGRPGEWTSDDVEGARLMANVTVRANGSTPEAPEAIWRRRSRITPRERDRFAERVRRYRAEALNEKKVTSLEKLSVWGHAAVVRLALRRALEAHGIVSIKRRRITLPINPSLRVRIT